MATKSSLNSVYIPKCKKEICLHWLQRIVEGLKENDVKCRADHPINGKFTHWFKEFFEECDFTIIHCCPCLWKRILSQFEYFQSQQEKLILIKFSHNDWDDMTLDSPAPESLRSFFHEMDSEQFIGNDDDLKNFIENVIHSTSPILHNESVESIEDTTTESVGSFESSSCNDDHSLVHYYGAKKQYDSPENQVEVSDNFKKYHDLFGSVEDMFVSVRCCDAEWVPPSGWQDVPRSKRVEQINEFNSDDFHDICFILHRHLPELYQRKLIVDLSHVITCKWNVLRERALSLLEFILWESGDSQLSHMKDVNILVNIDTDLSEVLDTLNEESEIDSRSSELKEHIAQVSLMLLSNIILLSESSQKAAMSAENHFKTKEIELSASDTPYSASFRTFVSDGVRCSHVHEIVNRFLQMESQTECSAKNLRKESFCVQFTVLYELLRKVYSLKKEPLKFLEDYLKSATKVKLAWKKKYSTPKACITLILRGMTMFLSHCIRKKGHMDNKEICNQSLNILAAIASEGSSKQEIETFLLPLIFDSRDSIRQQVKNILKSMKKDNQECLLNFGLKAVEQLLSPFVKDVPNIPVREKSKAESKAKTSSNLPHWNELKIEYSHAPAQLFIHTISKEDHEKQNKTVLKEQKDLHYTEILNLMKLKHENVITMFAFQVRKMPQFYILEDGQRVQTAMKNARDNQKFFENTVLCTFVVDALKGLRYCHDQGYIHRNLTAHSLCIFNMQSVKLCDFGLCMKQASVEVAIDKNSKTIPLRWSAPESIFKGEFSKLSDIWMIGHLVYEVLTHGLLPYSPPRLSDEDFVEALNSEIRLQKQQCLDDEVFDLIMMCTDYNSQSRPSIEEVFTKFEVIQLSQKELSKAEKFYPATDGDKGMCSIDFTRGIPEKYCLKNILRLASHAAGRQIIHISDSMELISIGDQIFFKEKLVHPMSVEATACIHSTEFEDILPPVKLHKNSTEAEHVVCEIPSSSRSFYELAQQRLLGDGISVYMMLLHKVAEILCELHGRSWIIGDLSPSGVFVDTKTLKPYIVSLSLLQHIGQRDATNPEIAKEAEKIRPNRQSSAAPEVLSDGLFSVASDVFCFGNFIWALLTAFDKSEELSKILNDEEVRPFVGFSQKEQFLKALMTGKWQDANTKPQCCPEELYRLILQCVSINEKDRPTMQQMIEHLKGLFKKTDIEFALSHVREKKNDAQLLEENPSESSVSLSSRSSEIEHRKELRKSEKKKTSSILS